MKYYIIGGAGFIGSNFARYLTSLGEEVYINDNLSTGRANNLKGVPVTWEPNLMRGISECDYIIHLAASVGVDYVNNNPYQAMLNNIDMERKVFEINEVFKKPLLFASTSEVYGDSPVIPYREDAHAHVGAPTHGRWGYACSKLMGEFLALHSSFPAVVVRFFNVTGAGQLPDYGMVMPNFVNNALADNPLIVYGDGEQVRCFCHIADAVVAMKMLIESEVCYNQIFNIGNPDNMITMMRLAKKVIAMSVSDSKIEMQPLRNATDIRYRVPDISKIYDFVGWEPKVSLYTIVREMIDVHTDIY